MSTAPHGFLRVAAACPPVRVADPERNAGATVECVLRAHERGAQVLVLPELGLTGYTCGDLFFSLSTLVAGAERALERICRETEQVPAVVVVGLPVEQEGRLFNAAAVLQGGQVLGVVPKTYLPGCAEYYEERWFSSAREAREETSLEVRDLRQFHTYSDPSRDTRKHTISTVFIAKGVGIPIAADDAVDIGTFRRDEFPSPLCFDHDKILDDYFRNRNNREKG